jgi:hypothetical protein
MPMPSPHSHDDSRSKTSIFCFPTLMQRSSLNQIELLKQIDSSADADYHSGIFQSKTMEEKSHWFFENKKKNVIIFSNAHFL